MSTLTRNYVLAKTKKSDLKDVKNLNIWGSDLKDVSILREMSNVEVLSLSVNSIESLEDFSQCSALTELYLRKNHISDLRQVVYLRGLRNLSVLWLCDNPIAADPSYRYYVIRALPQLKRLDDQDVSPDEVQNAARAKLPIPIELPSKGTPQQAQLQAQQHDQRAGEADSHRRRGWDEATAGPVAQPSAQPQPIYQAQVQPPQQTLAPQAAVQHSYQPSARGAPSEPSRNKSILLAILNLMNELDYDSLDVVRREAMTQMKLNVK